MALLSKDGETESEDKKECFSLQVFLKENPEICLKESLCCTSTRKTRMFQ